MTEAKFQQRFNKWLVRQHGWNRTCVFELKVENKEPYINFKVVKPHQLRNLNLAQHKMIWKIPDEGRGQKPFDAFMICEARAFVVVWFARWRFPDEFFMIPVEAWEKEMMASKRKSLTMLRAGEIGRRESF